jgi:hypothetical protein
MTYAESCIVLIRGSEVCVFLKTCGGKRQVLSQRVSYTASDFRPSLLVRLRQFFQLSHEYCVYKLPYTTYNITVGFCNFNNTCTWRLPLGDYCARTLTGMSRDFRVMLLSPTLKKGTRVNFFQLDDLKALMVLMYKGVIYIAF